MYDRSEFQKQYQYMYVYKIQKSLLTMVLKCGGACKLLGKKVQALSKHMHIIHVSITAQSLKMSAKRYDRKWLHKVRTIIQNVVKHDKVQLNVDLL
jgi:hypothetical protein